MTHDAVLAEVRPAAFAVAYRMLGSVTEAEDVVQEALLRLHRALDAGEPIASPRAYVVTVASRLAIDGLRSARARRETYVGEWLPEPLVDDDPARHAEVADSLSMAFLVLLETLSPEQRAAFLLREVFDYDYARIAEIVGTSDANARQLVARARRHVEAGRPRFDASRAQRDALADRFFAAVGDGDLGALEALLAEDVVITGDGGGKAPALARAQFGRARIVQLLGAWLRLVPRIGTLGIRRVDANGQPGAVLATADEHVIAVMTLEIAGGRVQGIKSVVNPDKIGHVGPPADVVGLLRRSR